MHAEKLRKRNRKQGRRRSDRNISDIMCFVLKRDTLSSYNLYNHFQHLASDGIHRLECFTFYFTKRNPLHFLMQRWWCFEGFYKGASTRYMQGCIMCWLRKISKRRWALKATVVKLWQEYYISPNSLILSYAQSNKTVNIVNPALLQIC